MNEHRDRHIYGKESEGRGLGDLLMLVLIMFVVIVVFGYAALLLVDMVGDVRTQIANGLTGKSPK